jgi:hypothetical protein
MNADLPTLQPVGAHPGFTVGGQKHEKQHRAIGNARRSARFQSLGLVLERLWTFHEAMRTGRPLERSDEILAEVGSALRRTKGR